MVSAIKPRREELEVIAKGNRRVLLALEALFEQSEEQSSDDQVLAALSQVSALRGVVSNTASRFAELEAQTEALADQISNLETGGDMDISQAENVVANLYGDSVSVEAAARNIDKFGRNVSVGTSYETIAEFQGSVGNEAYLSTNLIDSIASSSASDQSKTVVIEGFTIDALGNLTVVTQDATTDATDGRTKVTLVTPLARATRIYLKSSGVFDSPQSALAGDLHVYDDTDGETNGVPNTDDATKLMLLAGATQSEKAATATAQNEYWFIRSFFAHIGDTGGNASYVTVRMEVRDIINGGVFRPMGGEMVLVVGQQSVPEMFSPVLIVPKNHDWRVVAKADSQTADVYAEAQGYLAEVV